MKTMSKQQIKSKLSVARSATDEPQYFSGPLPETRQVEDQIEGMQELVLALLKRVEALEKAPELTAAADFDDEVRRFEIKLIRQALRQTGGNQRRAAQLLKIKASRLNYKIKTYKIAC